MTVHIDDTTNSNKRNTVLPVIILQKLLVLVSQKQ